jgi:sugar O-acyltransferase (sialic acid O-acetyltransferase NeuD family)
MVIAGAKGFAKEVMELFAQINGNEQRIYFFDNISDNIPDSLFYKYKILKTFDEVAEIFETESNEFVLGVGTPIIRFKLFKQLEKLGGKLVSAISPYAKIGKHGNDVGKGCSIMTGAIVTSDVKIGIGCLLNLNSTIGHDSVIGDFVELSPGVAISGRCRVGSFSNIGTNATLLPGIEIGENVVVAAGCVVTKNIPSNSVVVGLPGVVRKHLPPINLEF